MTNRSRPPQKASFVDAVRSRLGVASRASHDDIVTALDTRLADRSPLEVAIAKAGWAAPKRKGA